jgi:hypothetical protein
MNPDLLANYDEETQGMWWRPRIADRAQAIVAHELAEHEYGGDPELALIAAPETKLPISHRREYSVRIETLNSPVPCAVSPPSSTSCARKRDDPPRVAAPSHSTDLWRLAPLFARCAPRRS